MRSTTNISINPRAGEIEISDRGRINFYNIDQEGITSILETLKETYPERIRINGVSRATLEKAKQKIEEYMEEKANGI